VIFSSALPMTYHSAKVQTSQCYLLSFLSTQLRLVLQLSISLGWILIRAFSLPRTSGLFYIVSFCVWGGWGSKLDLHSPTAQNLGVFLFIFYRSYVCCLKTVLNLLFLVSAFNCLWGKFPVLFCKYYTHLISKCQLWLHFLQTERKCNQHNQTHVVYS
jgi:hypothetical protein